MTAADTDYADPCAVLPRIREAYYALLEGRNAQRPEGSYTTYLFEKGREKADLPILREKGEIRSLC